MNKKFYSMTTFLVGLSACAAFAQVVLTSNSFPVIGDQQTINLYDTLNVSPGGGGTSQTWDFSNLGVPKSSQITKFVLPSSTTYGFKFPTATFAQVDPTVQDGISYSYINANEYGALGATLTQSVQNQVGTNTVIYSNSQKAMNFPFTFRSVCNDDFTGTLTNTITPYTTVRTGTTSVIADGTGALILPDSRKFNAMRVTSFQQIEDVTDFSEEDFIYKSLLTSKITTYNWFAEGFKGPVMAIHYFEIESSMIIDEDTVRGGTQSTKSVLVYEQVVASVEQEYLKGNLFSVSPNPFGNEGFVYFMLESEGQVNIQLKSLQGTLLKEIYNGWGHAGENHVDFTMALESPGMYMLEISHGKNKAYRKVIKK